MAIHCIHCGTELPDIAQFCLTCGKSPRGEAPATATPSVSASPPETYPAYLQAPTIRSDGPSAPDPLTRPPPPLASYYSTESLYAPGSASAPSGPPPAQKKSRRGLWIALAAIVVVLVVGGGGVAYYLANQSTPTKTLQAACDDEKSGDYQSLYNLYTTDFQQQVGPEGPYAANFQQFVSSHGGVVSCTVSAVSQNGSSATGTDITTFGDGTRGVVTILLTDENGTWKISGTAG